MPSRFDAIFEAQRPRLHGVVRRVLGDPGESEEVVQEAFLRLSTSGVLARPDDEVAAWLTRVGVNLAFNRRRDRARFEARTERAGRLNRDGDAADPAVAVLQREDREDVRRVLAELPERQR